MATDDCHAGCRHYYAVPGWHCHEYSHTLDTPLPYDNIIGRLALVARFAAIGEAIDAATYEVTSLRHYASAIDIVTLVTLMPQTSGQITANTH